MIILDRKILNQELTQGTPLDIALATAFAAGPVSGACEVLEEKEGLPPAQGQRIEFDTRVFVKMMLGKQLCHLCFLAYGFSPMMPIVLKAS